MFESTGLLTNKGKCPACKLPVQAVMRNRLIVGCVTLPAAFAFLSEALGIDYAYHYVVLLAACLVQLVGTLFAWPSFELRKLPER